MRGEELAAAWYGARGYDLVDRNWRCPQGELDIVAVKGPVLVFCEVKTRTSTQFGSPAEAVLAPKQARIRRLAGQWLALNRDRIGTRRWNVRFDVAAVLRDEIEVIEAAF